MNGDYYIQQQWNRHTDEEARYNLLERIEEINSELKKLADELHEAYVKDCATCESRIKQRMEALENELMQLEE